MDIMNFNKALSILGLTRNYTEEDLKKTYRKLITKYHPDLYENKSEQEKKMAEEKVKEINAAKEFLEKYKGRDTNNSSKNNNYYHHSFYDHLVFVQAKSSFIDELSNNGNELREFMFKTIPVVLQKTIESLRRKNYLYLDIIENVRNIEELNKRIIAYKAEVWKELEVFTFEYCKKYDINTDTSKLEKYSLKKLYEQLEKIRKKQNKNNNILDIIEEEYTLYAGYEVIKENISKIKKDILGEYNKGLYNEEEAKRKFGTRVLLEFKEYYRRLEIIKYFKSLGYKDDVIVINIELMEKHITRDKETFRMYEKSITNYIADKESRLLSKTTFEPLNIKGKKFNTNNKSVIKDEFIKSEYKIKKIIK